VPADERLARLRELVAQIERLPGSTRREWMLTEARARIVAVETGEAPQPMRSLEAMPLPRSRVPAQASGDAGSHATPR
jgi:hypothetical protein